MSWIATISIPLSIAVAAQIWKLVWAAARHGVWEWKILNNYGGMPSAHAALVSSFSAAIGLNEGVESPHFAIAIIFSVIILRDAMGFRYKLGRHGKILNMLIEDLPDDIEIKYPHHLEEQFGHTPFEVLVGTIIGVGLTLVANTFI